MYTTLQFVHSFVPIYGGTTTRLKELLLNDGEHHALITIFNKHLNDKKQELASEEIISNILVKRINAEHIERTNIPLLNTFIYEKRLTEKLLYNSLGIHSDVIVGHNPVFFGETALKCSMKTNKPFIYEIHRLIYDTDFSSIPTIKKRLWNKINQIREWRLVNNAKKIIVQTDMIHERLVNMYKISPEKVEVIPMGINPVLFNPTICSKKNNSLIEKKTINNKKIKFLYNGYLGRETGLDFFVNSFLKLPDDIKKRIHTIIAGRGELKNKVEKYENDYPELFTYLGLIDYNKMPELYSISDVHVLPYPHKHAWDLNVPTKLLEGMAMKKLMLCSDVGGIKSVLNGNGIIYKAESEDSFISQIKGIVDNFKNLKTRFTDNRKIVVENYNWANLRETNKQLYYQSINN